MFLSAFSERRSCFYKRNRLKLPGQSVPSQGSSQTGFRGNSGKQREKGKAEVGRGTARYTPMSSRCPQVPFLHKQILQAIVFNVGLKPDFPLMVIEYFLCGKLNLINLQGLGCLLISCERSFSRKKSIQLSFDQMTMSRGSF